MLSERKNSSGGRGMVAFKRGDAGLLGVRKFGVKLVLD